MNSPMGSDRFSAQKCISVVRNPIDTLPSLSLLALTLTHSKQLATPINEADPDWWNRFMTRTGKAINDCAMVMRQQVETTIPTYYIRYEDLVLNPLPVLRELF